MRLHAEPPLRMMQAIVDRARGVLDDVGSVHWLQREALEGEALERLGGTAVFEAKLDGARVQVHRSGDAVSIYTRSLDDVTGRFFDRETETRAEDQAYDPAARRRLWELSEQLANDFLR